MQTERLTRYNRAIDFAEQQVRSFMEAHPDAFPTYTANGVWQFEPHPWTIWAHGFWPGIMWQFYRRDADSNWNESAQHYARQVEGLMSNEDLHDHGLVYLNSHLPWYRNTRDRDVNQVLIQAGNKLAQKYQRRGRFFSSALGKQALMINVLANAPLVFYTANETLDQDIARYALAHCRTTRDRLMREDGSMGQWIEFDPGRGEFTDQKTFQGFSSTSCWSRGLAWSLYGYTRIHAITSIGEMLDLAEKNANYWLEHLPKDGVPFWDFAVSESSLPETQLRDSSAAAIAASALLQLAEQTKSADAALKYRDSAALTLDTLCSDSYLAANDSNWQGTLKHGVFHAGENLGVDESLIWGDFYLVEALTSYLQRETP